jgi:hypothetical protein
MMNIDPDARGGARTAQDETIEQQIIHPESDCKIYPVPPKNELIKQRYG